MFEIYSQELNYLDPGTGSYLLQIILAATLTIGIYIKNLKNLFLNFYLKFKNKFKT